MTCFGSQQGMIAAIFTLKALFLSPSWISREGCSPGGSAVDQNITVESHDKEEELLKLYHQSFDDELVDLDLIMDLLHYICSTSSDGELSDVFYVPL